MIDYSAIRATARALLEEFGAELTLTREGSGGTYDPVSGETTGGADVTLSGVGVLVSFSNRELANGAIQVTDKKLIFSGDPLAIGDNLNGWRVLSINDIDPDGSGAVVTLAQMRR